MTGGAIWKSILDPFTRKYMLGLCSFKRLCEENGALLNSLLNYQYFDLWQWRESTSENNHFMDTLKNLEYQHDGPNNLRLSRWRKRLALCERYGGHHRKNLLKSFGKKATCQKAKSFIIELKRLNQDELQLFKDITSSYQWPSRLSG